MDAEYIGSMDNDDIRLEAVADSDYETKGVNSYLSEITDSFEPLELEVSSSCYPCASRVLTIICHREMIRVMLLNSATSGLSLHIKYA